MKQLLAAQGKKIIDTAENTIALNPTLSRWWGMAVVSFEPVERIEKGARLLLRWLRRSGKNVSIAYL
jgi:hypothetical protein